MDTFDDDTMGKLVEKFLKYAMRIQLSQLDFGRSTALHHGAHLCETFPAAHLLDAYDARNPFKGKCSDYGDDEGNLCAEPDPQLSGRLKLPRRGDTEGTARWRRAECCTVDEDARKAAIKAYSDEMLPHEKSDLGEIQGPAMTMMDGSEPLLRGSEL